MIYQLFREQKLAISLTEAWDFFSSPENLKEITPAFMGFDILSKTGGVDGDRMFAGQIIKYRVRPLGKIALTWVTEIGPVVEKSYFVDRQLQGPYAIWHHKHLFRQIAGGTLIQDIVDYKLPFGPFGRLVHLLSVRKQLEAIFDYRQERLTQIFTPYRA